MLLLIKVNPLLNYIINHSHFQVRILSVLDVSSIVIINKMW